MPGNVRAGAFATLTEEKNLTPERLAHYLGGFTYELSDCVQDAEVFLKRKRVPGCKVHYSLRPALAWTSANRLSFVPALRRLARSKAAGLGHM